MRWEMSVVICWLFLRILFLTAGFGKTISLRTAALSMFPYNSYLSGHKSGGLNTVGPADEVNSTWCRLAGRCWRWWPYSRGWQEHSTRCTRQRLPGLASSAPTRQNRTWLSQHSPLTNYHSVRGISYGITFNNSTSDHNIRMNFRSRTIMNIKNFVWEHVT